MCKKKEGPERVTKIECISCGEGMGLKKEFPLEGGESMMCGNCGTVMPCDSSGHQTKEDLERHMEKLESLMTIENEHEISGMWWMLREAVPILAGSVFSIPIFMTFFFNGSTDPTFAMVVGTVLTLVGYFTAFFFTRSMIDRFLFERFVENHPEIEAVSYDFYNDYDIEMES